MCFLGVASDSCQMATGHAYHVCFVSYYSLWLSLTDNGEAGAGPAFIKGMDTGAVLGASTTGVTVTIGLGSGEA